MILKTILPAGLLSIVLLLAINVSAQLVTNPVDFVDSRVGTTNDGSSCVIGPQLPFGSINPSPQTPNGENDGYDPGQPIRGFGQLHVSGTGYGKYGQIFLSPQVGLAVGETAHDSPKTNEIAFPYEYGVTLTRYNIRTEFTPSYHSAIYKFTFPETTDGHLLIDISHNIPMDLIPSMNGKISQGKVSIDSINNTIKGYGKYTGGFGGGDYIVYFFARLDKKPSLCGTWKNGLVQPRDTVESIGAVNDHIGAYLKFNTAANEIVRLKVAVSFKSIAQARIWLETEIPDWNYDAVKEKAKSAWNTELSKILIEDSSADSRKIFYSAMYHAMLMPRNRTNDMTGFAEGASVWDDHYAVWDTWRTLYPLMSLINQPMVTGTINSFIERFKKNKRVRDAYIAGFDMAEEQGGNNIDNIIADGYVKGIPGVDWAAAYTVLKNDADKERAGWQGWGTFGINNTLMASYKTKGWIPAGIMSCSKSLEYSYNDYCTALVAKGLGKTADYTTYLDRSQKWVNLWNPEATSDQYKGFIVPKNADGSWVGIDMKKNWGSWQDYFYEASSWTYSYFVPHQMDKLVYLTGGADQFAAKLDYGFKYGLIDYANEPAFLAVQAFHYAGRPDLASFWVRKLMTTKYTTKGYPGNDDSGAMSSWYIFSSLGFFPNAGQDIYYLVGPLFTKSSISLGEGKTISIEAQNASKTNLYIQSCSINGVEWTKSWFSHADIKDGATIKFVMGPNPSNWAKSDESLKYQEPTSINNLKQDTGELIYPNPATDLVTIVMQGKKYRELSVFDAAGKLAYHQPIEPDSALMTLDVKNWTKGIYFIHLRHESGSTNSKLIIE
ncbi:MAG TPA: GH92 family glycosyl hydrolase [Prolixibacteraceae bacterium]|jgi:predicted alpha-1,2-mannosidase